MNQPFASKSWGNFDFLVVCLYVDDMIYMGSCESLVEEFKYCMMGMFDMSDIGLLHYFLGVELNQSKDDIFISQKKYVTDLLTKFGMLNCKWMPTPMNVNEKLIVDYGTSMANAKQLRSIIVGLHYLCHTRPDITFSVSVLSRFMHNPWLQHLGAAKRVLRYVAGTIDFGIWYSKVSNFRLCGFSDSDWEGCLEGRRSPSGCIFSLGFGAISWSSKKQDTVALSSSEAKYVAVIGATCQTVWRQRLLTDCFQVQEDTIEIFCDNKATTAMTKNPTFHSRTKHIDIRYHFIWNMVANEEITLSYCSTHKQVANILTKPLRRAKHEVFRL